MNSASNIQAWFDAVQMYDQGVVGDAITKFGEVLTSAKILFNIGCCYLRQEDINSAATKYSQAIKMDPHLAVAYFMMGLTKFLDEDYSDAMDFFQESHKKLRGNRCVDYRQLGFKYQLYSCEILTNQAVCSYKLNQLNKAKGLLLEAVGCKAEKKHESIMESLNLLQSGYPITPFIPPQCEIFRPPKSAVENLKKKNYLGKSKVISTENSDEIYACFSGIKDQRNEPKPASKALPQKGLMQDLKLDRRGTLRPVPRPPRKQPSELVGNVMENKANTLPVGSSGKKKPPPTRGLPSGPDIEKSSEPPKRRLPSAPVSYAMRELPPSPTSSPPPSRASKTLPPLSKLGTPTAAMRPRSPNILDRNNNHEDYDDGETYEEIDEKSIKYRPNRPPPILPKRSSEIEIESVPRQRLPSNPIPNRRPPSVVSLPEGFTTDQPPQKPPYNRQKIESDDIFRPDRAPPPPPTTQSESSDITAPPRKFLPSPENSQNEADLKKEIGNVLKKKKKPTDIAPGKKSPSSFNPTSPTGSKVVYEVEVQYTFIQKISVPEGTMLEDLETIVKEKGVPDDIEICFNDDLGRQQVLTERKMKKVFDQDTSNVKKLFCFPES